MGCYLIFCVMITVIVLPFFKLYIYIRLIKGRSVKQEDSINCLRIVFEKRQEREQETILRKKQNTVILT